jgi:Peptidase family S41
MNKYYLTILLSFIVYNILAQDTSNYSKDLNQLYTVLKKTPSYKSQIKGDQKTAYTALYNHLQKEIVDDPNSFQYFYNLSQLLMPIKDNHLGFYQLPLTFLDPKKFSDTSLVKKYKAMPIYKAYPKTTINLDSLETVLKSKSKDSVEGIYHYDQYLKVGLYRTIKKDSLIAIVLETKMPNWDIGQIAFLLMEHHPNRFRAYYIHPVYRNFLLNKNEKFIDASLSESYFYQSVSESIWKKFPNEVDYKNLDSKQPLFSFKTIDNKTQYLRLGSFSADNKQWVISKNFYESIKDSLHSKNLIVDLRNNSGGAAKASRPFVKLIKKYSRKHQVYVIINNRTFSNGEIVTHQLKKKKRITILGETTNGTIAYGSNYGNIITLPSGKYRLYPTDMKDWFNYKRFEEKGISPTIYLDPNSDWLQQVIKIIAQKSSAH